MTSKAWKSLVLNHTPINTGSILIGLRLNCWRVTFQTLHCMAHVWMAFDTLVLLLAAAAHSIMHKTDDSALQDTPPTASSTASQR